MVNQWSEKPLGELFDFFGGVSASRAQLSTNGYPYLHYGDIHGSKSTFIDVCSDSRIPRLDIDINKVSNATLLQNGDIVFVDASEDDEGASRHVVVRNSEGKPFISGLHTIIAKVKTEELDNLFKEYCFQTENIKAQFRFYAVGTKVTGVNKVSIAKVVLRYPTDKFEQHTIAKALSDMDNLIVSLEKLIKKKKAIKRGTMQELLTGKRRLPGFEGELVKVELQSLCSTFCDGDWIESKDQSSNGIRLIQTGNIGNGQFCNNSGRKRFITKETFRKLSCKEIFPGDVLVSRLPDPAGRSCIIPSTNERMITAVDCTIIRITKYNPTLFVMYSQTYQYQQQIDLFMAGSTRQRVGRKELGIVKIPVFPTIDEQTAIAEILSDMDMEIDALTTKINKLRLIKQGMMQELLTGQIRLVQPEAITEDSMEPEVQKTELAYKGHNQQFDDAVMIAGIVNAFYSEKYPLGRKKIQKLLYLLRRKQDESITMFKKKAAGPYADVVRYKGGEPIAQSSQYITTSTISGKGTTFSKGENIEQALDYIKKWGRQSDIQWLVNTFRYTGVNELELLSTVDMAICDLIEAGMSISVASIKHLIATNKEWKAKLKKKTFEDSRIAKAINDLETLL